MEHYEEILNNFIKWKNSNNNSNITNLDDLKYPDLDISPVKDDVVEYMTEEN